MLTRSIEEIHANSNKSNMVAAAINKLVLQHEKNSE